MKKHISVLTPCYNEKDNVEPLSVAVAKVFENRPQYTYEHLFIDNDSTDDTVKVLRAVAEKNRNVKVI